ncbi:RidA family protein [Arenibaculum sp.]|uniref:RidA family protein n=1 Tax=Arenibaculum sp. TaxID=2865862 RepID=UPI002E0D2744|nr:RidA family protein [Arenibaculum sp.]
MTTIAEKLTALGLSLRPAAAPAGNYVPTVRAGNLLHVSGQISLVDGKPGFLGRLGAELDVEQGREAARAAALGVLSQVAGATDGTVAAVRRVVRLNVFVAATPEFTRHPDVADGASDLMVAVFGEAGKHARAAVGVASLPRGVAVEVDAVVEIEDRA